jgi:hypothetical protein
MVGLAAMMAAMGNEQRQNQILAMEMQKLNAPKDTSAEGMKMVAGAIAKIAETMQEQNRAILEEIRELKQGGNNTDKEKLFEMQREMMNKTTEFNNKLMESQREMLENKFASEINQLKSLAESRQNTEMSINQIRDAIEASRAMGMPISTTSLEQEKLKMDYDLKVRELEMRENDQKMRMEAENRQKEATAAGLSALGKVLGQTTEMMKIRKHITGGGSEGAKVIAGRR